MISKNSFSTRTSAGQYIDAISTRLKRSPTSFTLTGREGLRQTAPLEP
jgi:hypothetical protein